MRGKSYLLLLSLLFLSACAPMVCPEGEKVKRYYSQYFVPNSYTASLSLRQGFLRIPLQVKKEDGRFTISDERRNMDINLDNLCVGGICFDLPVGIDGLLFGKVLKGDEKALCSPGGVVFERDEGSFKLRYVFKDGRLNLVEVYNKERAKILTLNYLDWSREGYARAIKIEGENMNFILTVDSIKF